MIYNRPSSLSHLKSFGCLYYATVVSPKQKLDPHARQCIFIGYPPNKKGYKLFDIDANTFFTSRDVTFHESVFPFCQQFQQQSLPPLQDIFPAIDIDLPTPVQHSLDQPSSLTRHNALEPPANQPFSPTRHNAPEPPADQLFSPTPEGLTPITEPSPTDLPIRQSSHTSTPHFWPQDYVTGSQVNHSTTAQDRSNGTRYPMHHFFSNSRFSSTHNAYLANITSTKEPHTYAQTIFDPNWQKTPCS